MSVLFRPKEDMATTSAINDNNSADNGDQTNEIDGITNVQLNDTDTKTKNSTDVLNDNNNSNDYENGNDQNSALVDKIAQPPQHVNKSSPSIEDNETDATSIIQSHSMDDLLEDFPLSEEEIDNENKYELEEGDHIYSWMAMGTYSHHGLVLSVSKVSVFIIDFYPHEQRQRKEKDNSDQKEDRLRVLNLQEWVKFYGRPRKVTYNASYMKRTLYRSGTCCSMESHDSFLVLARAKFLLKSPYPNDDHLLKVDDENKKEEKKEEDHIDYHHENVLKKPSLPKDNRCYLPKYHYLHANSETLCVWCKTGHYSTLQVADFLHLTWAGQLKSGVTLTAFLSAKTVEVPAAGVWGYMGFTTKVGLLAAQPMILPALMGYGIVTVGTPLWMLRKCHVVWKEVEDDLNDLFWRGGLNVGDSPLNDLILECLDNWYTSPPTLPPPTLTKSSSKAEIVFV